MIKKFYEYAENVNKKSITDITPELLADEFLRLQEVFYYDITITIKDGDVYISCVIVDDKISEFTNGVTDSIDIGFRNKNIKHCVDAKNEFNRIKYFFEEIFNVNFVVLYAAEGYTWSDIKITKK